MSRLVAVCAVALSLSASTRAWGQDAPPSQAATDKYMEGRDLIQQGRLDEALSALEASQALLPSPNTQLLIAHTLRELNRRPEAMPVYEAVIEEAGVRMRAGEDRFRPTLEEAGRWVAVLRAELVQIVVTIRHVPPDASMKIGDRLVSSRVEPDGILRAKQWSEPGDLVVTIEAPDGREIRRDVALSAGGQVLIDADFTAEAGVAALPPPDPVAPPEPEPAGDDRPFLAWPPPVPAVVVAGAGAVGLGLFVGFGLASSSVASDLEDCSPTCDESLRGDAETADRNQTIANIGLVIGAVGLGAGVAIWIVESQTARPTTTAHLVASPQGVRAAFSF